ncbi:hypothetical protein TrST_g8146 [Triparma strigata]|uniref:Ribosomal RNA methyltransferase FtsJ domain-containing protein n=1 Tax=Triparma strigata TaxID=1606541 RepID=A0A9W7AUZ4_9STRA|nr:hypothetical protein TrST_g8146 [Triparma strigata]
MDDPFLVLRTCGHSHKNRFISFFTTNLSEYGAELMTNEGSLLIFSLKYPPNSPLLNATSLLSNLRSSLPIFSRYASLIFLTTSPPCPYADLLADPKLSDPEVTLKLAKTSPELKKSLINDLPPSVKMSPDSSSCTHTLECVSTSSSPPKFYYSLTPNPSPLLLPPPPSPPPICRSYYKLSESLSSYNLLHKKCIDIGSSPGGWTSYLLERGVDNIICVDPGVMEIKDDRLVHMKCKFEDALLDISSLKFDVLVCDANVFPEVAVGFLEKTIGIMEEECLVNVTLKLTNGRWEGEEVIERIKVMGGFDEVKVEWLFANGRKERNMLLRRSKKIS